MFSVVCVLSVDRSKQTWTPGSLLFLSHFFFFVIFPISFPSQKKRGQQEMHVIVLVMTAEIIAKRFGHPKATKASRETRLGINKPVFQARLMTWSMKRPEIYTY